MMFSCKTLLQSIGLVGALMLGLSSCHTPKDITYFQDLENGARQELAEAKELVVMPDDRLSITIHSKDPQLAMLFNLPLMSTRIGQVNSIISNNSNQVATYTVDAYGDIEFPVLGTMHIGGMKRAEVANYIKTELLQRNLVKDPTVIVDFLNRSVNVLGEVTHPGRVEIDRDRFTILDAIAGAGDLTIQGKRTNVLVLRMEDGRKVAHKIDLTDASSTLSSPVFYLQQDDVIYVEPTDVRKRATTANGNSIFTPSFWISIASFATTVLLLIKNW